MLERLARFCFRRRRWVAAGWVFGLIGIQIWSGVAGSAFAQNFQLPNVESKQVLDALKRADPNRAGLAGRIVFRTDGNVNDPAVREPMTSIFDQVKALGPNVDVISPYTPQGAAQISPDGHVAYASLDFRDIGQDQLKKLADQIEAIGKTAPDNVDVYFGGEMFRKFELPPSELLGVAAAIVILLVAFGSVIAMGLPVGIALVGLGVGFGIVTLWSHVMDMPDISAQVMAMIGLGVGIDYALFIVTRYREAYRAGSAPEEAVAEALDTAGRATLFAGITVVASLMGMFLMGFSFVRGLAVGGTIGVLVMMAATVTLLPALLGFVGDNIDKWRVGRRKQQTSLRESFWYRWSRMVQHRPGRAFFAALAVLLILAIPMLSLRMGSNDESTDPASSTARQAYETLASGFGPGFNGPFILTADVPGTADPATLAKITDALKNTPQVAQVSPAAVRDGVAIWFVVPETGPQDAATSKLVHHLRENVLPEAQAGTGLKVLVGGSTAINVDFADYLGKRLPIFMAAVLIVSFLLLMMVFRSLLVPLKAVIMNLLSIAAAYGVVVAIFQWGWLKDVIGLSATGPVESWAPMMLFAIVFGLSMDYEVFLLSRMKEEYDYTHDNGTAVADGLAATARVITAAALIMVCVFLSFVIGDNRVLKMFGVGLAAAVFIDATVVRMVLVPATMELLGDRNWWMPRWLDRILPKLHVEGGRHRPAVQAEPTEQIPVPEPV